MALFETPLAYRMRPRCLEEFIGQEHLVGPGRLLYKAIKNDRIPSSIFYGPPGTGKTSLARIIASATKSHFVQIDATSTGVAELRKIINEARDRLRHYNQRTILFIDEIHRFNKAQQDVLLPAVERGTVILIGATVENQGIPLLPAQREAPRRAFRTYPEGQRARPWRFEDQNCPRGCGALAAGGWR